MTLLQFFQEIYTAGQVVSTYPRSPAVHGLHSRSNAVGLGFFSLFSFFLQLGMLKKQRTAVDKQKRKFFLLGQSCDL